MRSDLSDYLVHWTRGNDEDDACDHLNSIINDRYIKGGTKNRRGAIMSVCFTEAPGKVFHEIVGKYSGFGIQVSKKWAFSQGARPVIYQRDTEYTMLPVSLRWRHVRYEPDNPKPFDFSWEREWRIPTDTLKLESGEFGLWLPNSTWTAKLSNTGRPVPIVGFVGKQKTGE